MRFLVVGMALLGCVLLSACEEEGKYPVSGEECTQSDPVKDMTTSDCLPPPANA